MNLNVLGKIQKSIKPLTFSVPIEKEVTKVDKDANENVVSISYNMKFVGSARLMGKFIIKSC